MKSDQQTAAPRLGKQSDLVALEARLDKLVPNGRKLQPHQRLSFLFSALRANSYLALDPGLGKTIVAALLCAHFGPPVLYLTPPYLVVNIVEEFKKWAPSLRLTVYRTQRRSGKNPIDLEATDVLLMPDSLLSQKNLFEFLLLHRRMYGERLSAIFIDEAQRFNRETSKRSQALYKSVGELFDKKIFLSGTPMPNRPIELYGVLSYAAPKSINFMNRFDYGRRYCGGYKNAFGKWDFNGSSNMEELGRRIKHPTGDFMLRIKKDEIKLPPKIEELFIVSKDMTPRLAQMDAKIGKAYGSAEDLLRAALAADAKKEDLHLMSYRRMLALEKVKPTAEYLEMLLSETQESILVFALHTEATEALYEAMAKFKPYIITGKTLTQDRQKLVDDFQASGMKRRLFIGNILAMGVGLTMTKANRVIFMEYHYSPGVNDQASDRAHRIGQEDTVYVQYVVYQNSIDKKVLETILKKRESMRFV